MMEFWCSANSCFWGKRATKDDFCQGAVPFRAGVQYSAGFTHSEQREIEFKRDWGKLFCHLRVTRIPVGAPGKHASYHTKYATIGRSLTDAI